MKLLIFVAVGLFVGFCFGVTWRDVKTGISPEFAIETLEEARDAHQHYVDNPELIWWAEDASQDAEWVESYNSIIRLLEVE